MRDFSFRKLYKYFTLIIMIIYPVMKFYTMGGVRFNLSVADILVPFYFLLWLLNIKNFSLKKNFPHFWYFITYTVILVISYLYNKNSSAETAGLMGFISEAVKFITCAAYFFIAYNSFDDEKDIKFVSLAWVAGIWIFIIYGLINSPTRFVGTFTDPNGAGSFLTFSFFIVFIMIFIYDKAYMKIFFCITEAVIIMCILLTQSRGTWVGFAVGIVVLAILFFKKINKIMLFILPLLAISYLLFVNVDFNSDYKISQDLIHRITSVSDGSGMFLIRKNLSYESIMMGLDNPLLGVGRGNFVLNSTPYADKLYTNQDYIYNQMTTEIPHNTFAGIFAELGLLGLIAFSSLFFVILYKFIKKRNNINFILLAGMAAFFVQSIVLCLENSRVLWIYLAIALKLQNVEFDINMAEVTLKKISIKKYVVICPIIILLIYAYTSIRVTNFRNLSEPAQYVIKNNNEPIDVYYKLASAARNLTSIEVDDGNDVTEYGNISADGYGNFTIPANAESESFTLTLKSRTENNSELRSLYYISNGKKTSLMDYKFLPGIFEKGLNWLQLLQTDSYEYKPAEPLKDYVINENFEIIDITLDDGVTFEILFKKKTEKSTVILTYYYIDNILLSPNSRNIVIQGFDLKPMSENWTEGEIYKYKDAFKGVEAVYNVEVMINSVLYSVGEVELGYRHMSDYLNNLDKNKLIIISIRDEGTNALDFKAISSLWKFGLDAELIDKTRYGYIAVASKADGFIPYEALGNEVLKAEFKKDEKFGDYDLPFDLNVISSGVADQQLSSIIIDEVEYSPNSRGMNIIVYDMVERAIVDVVCFDTYVSVFTENLK